MRNHLVPKLTFAALALALVLPSCSLTSIAVKAISSGGSGGGSLATFMRENDPEIVADSLPTLIKTLEILAESEPKDPDINLTVGSAYVMYANAFVEGPAKRLDSSQYEAKQAARIRAKNFYLRGAAYVAKALEGKFPGITTDVEKTKHYLPNLTKKWVSFAYWYSAGTCAAYSLDPFNLSISVRVPELKLLMDRAYELDPAFMSGSIPDFFISFHAAVPSALGGDPTKVEAYYRQAIELTKGQAPGPYLSYALAVSVPAQDAKRFREELNKALAINPDDHIDSRLMIILTQRNARYYLDHIDDYFLDAD
jgi:predicted anti-sigma-YlaC factor YlaD